MSICVDEQLEKECPLCMEQLDLDELNFFPCKCGYQICQFCWNRIKQEENGLCSAGLCPACRQPYPEQPVDFNPPSAEELKKIQHERRKREQQRKQKMSENRKHLANIRVVQRNLVLVHGLPPRLGDIESLKKNEYFGQFGKIHKIVIGTNSPTLNTSSAPSLNITQTPSSSVYVTYYKEEDAVKAILALNQKTIDGKIIRASLGTTKYCSCFLQNKPCQKTDCMYLHEVGDSDASFTKEDMATKKHEDYERKVCEEIIMKISANLTSSAVPASTTSNAQRDIFPSSAPSASCLLGEGVGAADLLGGSATSKSRDSSLTPRSGGPGGISDLSTSQATLAAPRACRPSAVNPPPPPRHRNRRDTTQQSHRKEATKSMSISPVEVSHLARVPDKPAVTTTALNFRGHLSASVSDLSVSDASSATPSSDQLPSTVTSFFARQEIPTSSNPSPGTMTAPAKVDDWCNGATRPVSVDTVAAGQPQSRAVFADDVGEDSSYKQRLKPFCQPSDSFEDPRLDDSVPSCSTSALLEFILKGATSNSSNSQQHAGFGGGNGLTKSSLLVRLANAGKLNLGSEKSHEECRLTSENNLKDKMPTDWQAACGFSKSDDDLGFDPFSESSKALEDLLREEKERETMEKQLLQHKNLHHQPQQQQQHFSNHSHQPQFPVVAGNYLLHQHNHHQQQLAALNCQKPLPPPPPHLLPQQATTAAWSAYHQQHHNPQNQHSQALAGSACGVFAAQSAGQATSGMGVGGPNGHQFGSHEGFVSSGMLRFGSACSSDFKMVNGGPMYAGGLGSLNAQAAPFVPRHVAPNSSQQQRDLNVKDMQEQFKAFFPDANVKFASSQLNSAVALPPPQVVCSRSSVAGWSPAQRPLDPRQAMFSRPPPPLAIGGTGGLAPRHPPPPGVKLSPPTAVVAGQPPPSSLQFGASAFSTDYSGWPVTGLAPTPPPGFAPPSHQLS